MKKSVLLGIVFVVLVIGFVVYSSLNTARYRCEVCMSFDGRSNCRVAAAQSRQEALRAGISNACALISSGVSESSRCEQTPPASVRWLSEGR